MSWIPVLSCAILLLRVIPQSEAQIKPKNCGPCKPDSCTRPVDCLAGMVYDFCGCCLVCGRIEGEKCDNDTLPLPYTHTYGYCGSQLECRLRDDLQPNDPAEAICVCTKTEVLCGSDGKTYSNACQLMEEAYRQRNGLKAVSREPCKSEPWIVTGPEHQKSVRGKNVAFSCEGMGYPVPTMEWQLVQTDGQLVDLPSDDQHIAVQARGGPEKYEVTGWLQVLDVQDEDVGTYHCIVRNEAGTAKASATITIVDTEDEIENEDDNQVNTK